MPKGIGTTRKGRPVMRVQTLLDRLFKKTAEVSAEEALQAAEILNKAPPRRARHYAEAGVVGGTLNPLVRGIGRAASGMVLAPKGQRLLGAAKAFTDTNRGEIAKHLTEGALAGGVVKSIQEGRELDRARHTVKKFLRGKEAMDLEQARKLKKLLLDKKPTLEADLDPEEY